MNLGALIATLGVNTAGLTAATVQMKTFERTASASIASVNAKLMASGAVMKKFGRNMSMFVTAPIALVGGAAFNMHKGFESSMTKIISLVGVARDQVEQWSEDILRIAPALGKSPKELADALFFITSAGIRGAEAMEVLTASAKASAVGLGETKVVADLVTSAMNAYGVQVLSAAKATDVLTAVVREGKAQADELAGSMGMVLPIASAMGVAFNEVGAAVAAMTRTGTKAQTASMQLRQILAALIKPSKQAADAMITMGTSAEELRKTIREDGLLKALMDIKDLSEIYGETVMAKVFPNVRALSGVLDLTGDNLEDTKKIFKELTNVIGDNERAFAEASKTAEFKWNAAISAGQVALTTLGKTIAESFTPVLEDIVEILTKATEWFNSLTDSQKKLGFQITLLLAVVGPLSLALGFIATSVLPGLIRMFYATAASVTTLNAVMLANPVLALGVAIAAAATALVLFNRRAKESVTVQNELSASQKKYNELVAEGLRLKDPVKNISEGMNIIKSLNERQLKDLKKQIQDRIILEEDYSAKLVTEYDKRKEENDMYVEWNTSSNEVRKKAARDYLNSARANWRLEIVSQRKANQERIALMESNVKEVERVLALLAATDKKDTSLAAVNEIMQALGAEIQFAKDMEEIFGKSFDTTTYMIEAQTEAIGQLLRVGIDPTNQGIQNLITSVNALKLTLEDVNSLFDADQIALFAMQERQAAVEANALDEAIARQILTMHGLTEKSFELASILGNVFSGMSNSISDALQSSENTLKAFGSFFTDFIKGMIIRLTAAAVTAFALAIALEVIGVGGGKVFKGLSAAAGLKDVFKAGFKSFSGMAEGGIVPAGYPNDTYPALLSSGEKVIPPGKLGSQSVDVQVQDILLEGDAIRIILRRSMEKHNLIT